MSKRSINEILTQGVHVNTEIPVIVESLREARDVLNLYAADDGIAAQKLLKKWDDSAGSSADQELAGHQ